jgi:hypothetical protein
MTMDADSSQAIIKLLTELRNNQALQIERQAEALTLQKEQHRIFVEQSERVQRIQDRAEAAQANYGKMVSGARKFVGVILLMIVVLLGFLGWWMYRMRLL